MGDKFIKREENMFSEISQFVENLRFRRSIYGVGMADAYGCIEELDEMYRKAFEEYQESVKRKAIEKQQELRMREQKIEEITNKTKKLQQGRIETEKRIQVLQQKLKTEQKYQKEYREKAELMATTLEKTRKSKDELLEKAQRETRSIVYDAEQKARQIVEKNEIDIENAIQRNQIVMREIEQVKKQAAENLRYIHSDLVSVDEEMSELKKKIEQIPLYINESKASATNNASQGFRNSSEVLEIKRNEKYDSSK